ncbi:hypothetical protein IFO70_34710 [Phormidium tenue FACHB-886]|nr:hypothetical protein [Phormidium tenue FACHB-886]
MKRFILASLSVLALSAVAAPSISASDRFEQERQDTLNDMSDSPEAATRSDRFNQEHQDTPDA